MLPLVRLAVIRPLAVGLKQFPCTSVAMSTTWTQRGNENPDATSYGKMEETRFENSASRSRPAHSGRNCDSVIAEAYPLLSVQPSWYGEDFTTLTEEQQRDVVRYNYYLYNH
eukprot:gb/GEZN01017296.1/.p1 GENE.gb/GEZN01017296.1/~~gb/GEZN01017296.1/.p1  ORF type:complete len:112 (-),score=7.23 gb/GEZN01017296.1/:412-747(-)